MECRGHPFGTVPLSNTFRYCLVVVFLKHCNTEMDPQEKRALLMGLGFLAVYTACWVLLFVQVTT